mgnify:FL=1
MKKILSQKFISMDYEVMKTLMENYANGYTYYVPVHRSRNGIGFSLGRWSGKLVSFFKRDETKIWAVVSYWAFETFTTLLAILTCSSGTAIAMLAVMWVYASYVLLSAIHAMNKTSTNGFIY